VQLCSMICGSSHASVRCPGEPVRAAVPVVRVLFAERGDAVRGNWPAAGRERGQRPFGAVLAFALRSAP
jgi:hypothetical protein